MCLVCMVMKVKSKSYMLGLCPETVGKVEVLFLSNFNFCSGESDSVLVQVLCVSGLSSCHDGCTGLSCAD